jgi:glutathione synthase/RimK-type ligase-like ATP-grasp enzyme
MRNLLLSTVIRVHIYTHDFTRPLQHPTFHMITKIAFLTMDSLQGFVSYDGLVRDILIQRKIGVDEISWRNPDAHWEQYDLVVIRSPWDYQSNCDAFLQALEKIEQSTTRLENCLNIVRWNIRKSYLMELQQAGISIIPTAWLQSPSVSDIRLLFEQLQADNIVIKPLVGANADNAFWLRTDSSPEILQQVATIFQDGTALAQPFIDSVIHFGEISLIFFAGEYSHSVLKNPRSGDFRVQEEHGGVIRPYEPEPRIIEFARRSLQAVPEPTLYARVDVVLLPDHSPAMMELEIIEPSLYLSYDSESPARFADAIEKLLRG